MRKSPFIIAFVIVLALAGFMHNQPTHYTYVSTAEVTDSVFISTNPNFETYHSSTECRTLRSNSHRYMKVSLEDAIYKYHKRACKDCE